MLRVDVLVYRHGCWWMLVVDVHECKKEKKKETLNGWWTQMVVDADGDRHRCG